MLRFFLASASFLFLIGCNRSEDISPNSPSSSNNLSWSSQTTVSNSAGESYAVGYDQASSINQDPWVRKTDANGNELWRLTYETTAVDGRAVLVALDDNEQPWVVFTVDGGSNSGDYISRKETADNAFSGVLFAGFGRASGAAKVSILAKLNPDNGQIERGTFLMARTNEGNINAVEKTNTLRVERLSVADNAIWVETHSWYKPPAVNATSGNFLHHPEASSENKNGNSYWTVRYQLKTDLSGFLQAEMVVE